jgi:hypothetical protein
LRGWWRPVQDPAAGAFGFVDVVAVVAFAGLFAEAVVLARPAGVLSAVDRSGSC